MMNITRQVNTAEVFDYKFLQLDAELEQKVGALEFEIDTLKSKVNGLNNQLLGLGSWTKIKMYLGIIIIIVACISMIPYAYENGDTNGIGVMVIGIIGMMYPLYLYIKLRKKNKLKYSIQTELAEAEKKIAFLYKRLTELPQEYSEIKREDREKLDQHMLNPSTLNEAEESHIQNKSNLKECPRCAELIKSRATYCRFCNSNI